MKVRIFHIWETIKTSLWFIPILLVLFLGIFAFVLIEIDKSLSDSWKIFIYNGSAEGAQLLLTTIAGSMITVAGVTFSITLVALTLTSSQFGPRLLRNFMVDKSNQFVLGIYIATFIYCLLILRAIQPLEGEIFIPRLAVSFSFVLAVIDLGFLIYFFHHISTSIRAETVVNSVYKELLETVDTFFQDNQEEYLLEEKTPEEPDFSKDTLEIKSQHSGYLRAIDISGLLNFAVKENLIIKVKYRPGDYVFTNSILALIISDEKPADKLSEKVNNMVLVGKSRSPEQDIEFALHQLVEVALRALSPGINDPYTAINCIDYIADFICRVNEMNFPSQYRYDKEGHLRLLLDVFTYEGIVNAAFNQIRQIAADNVAVNIRLLETLKYISQTARNEDQYNSIKRHAEMIYNSVKEQIGEKKDLEDIKERFQSIYKVLENE